jgi:hypothetical protein
LTAHLRELVVIQTLGEAPDSFSVTADQTPRLEGQARDLSQSEAVRAVDLIADAIAAVKEGSDARTQLELALLKAARPRADASVEALLLRIEQLERALEGEEDIPIRAEARIGRAETRKIEPAPEPEPPPQNADDDPPTTDPIVGLETLWPAVLDRVREGEGGEMLAALLADARPFSLEDDVLVLVYPQSASFSKRKIEDSPNGERLVQALRLVAGRPLSVRIELSDLEPAGDAGSSGGLTGLGRSGDVPSEDEMIDRIKDAFDAEDLPAGPGGQGPAPDDVPERTA